MSKAKCFTLNPLANSFVPGKISGANTMRSIAEAALNKLKRAGKGESLARRNTMASIVGELIILKYKDSENADLSKLESYLLEKIINNPLLKILPTNDKLVYKPSQSFDLSKFQPPKLSFLIVCFWGLNRHEQAVRPLLSLPCRPEIVKDKIWSLESFDKLLWNQSCVMNTCECPPMFGYTVPPDFFGNPMKISYSCSKQNIHLNHYPESLEGNEFILISSFSFSTLEESPFVDDVEDKVNSKINLEDLTQQFKNVLNEICALFAKYEVSEDCTEDEMDRKEEPIGYSEDRKEEPIGYSEDRKEEPIGYSEDRKEEPIGYSEDRKEEPIGYSEDRKKELIGYSEDRKEEPIGNSEDCKEPICNSEECKEATFDEEPICNSDKITSDGDRKVFSVWNDNKQPDELYGLKQENVDEDSDDLLLETEDYDVDEGVSKEIEEMIRRCLSSKNVKFPHLIEAFKHIAPIEETVICDPPCSVWCNNSTKDKDSAVTEDIKMAPESVLTNDIPVINLLTPEELESKEVNNAPVFDLKPVHDIPSNDVLKRSFRRSLSVNDCDPYNYGSRFDFTGTRIQTSNLNELLQFKFSGKDTGSFQQYSRSNSWKDTDSGFVSHSSSDEDLSDKEQDERSSMWGLFSGEDSLWKPLPECLTQNRSDDKVTHKRVRDLRRQRSLN